MSAEQVEMDEQMSTDAFGTTLRKKKLGILVDTGGYDNIAGSESLWFKEHTAHLRRLGMQPSVRDIPQMSVSGVGAGAATATQAFTFPGAVVDEDGVARNVMFDTPIVNGSPIPPIWGLQSLRKYRALIDCQGLKLHLLGAGDLRLSLPSGSRTFPLEMSDGGHLILPIGEFERLQEQNMTTPKKTFTLAAQAEPVDVPAKKTMVSQVTQTDFPSGHSSR